MIDLTRFVIMHDEMYEEALSEIKSGYKSGHWIWYIFPQLKGLGKSEISEYYGISDLKEAKAYMKHPVLGNHLVEICEVLYRLDDDVDYIFGYPDDMKVKSCMTLFEKACPKQKIFGKILDKFYNAERDHNTINLLNIP